MLLKVSGLMRFVALLICTTTVDTLMRDCGTIPPMFFNIHGIEPIWGIGESDNYDRKIFVVPARWLNPNLYLWHSLILYYIRVRIMRIPYNISVQIKAEIGSLIRDIRYCNRPNYPQPADSLLNSFLGDLIVIKL